MEQKTRSYRTKEQMRRQAIRKKKLRQRRRRIFFIECCLLICLLGFIFVHVKNQASGIPSEITDFVERYPEAESFASNYYDYKDSDSPISIDSEMQSDGIPLFIQWDKRWGYKDYGGNYIGIAGCGPTCLSMVYCGLTKDATYNPYEMAKFSNDHGYYTYGQGTSWSLMSDGAEALGLSSEPGSISSDYILENLSNSTPMICSMKPGDFTYSGHFIVLAGIDEEGKIIVNDPNSPEKSSYSWSADDLVPQIKAIWRFQR